MRLLGFTGQPVCRSLHHAVVFPQIWHGSAVAQMRLQLADAVVVWSDARGPGMHRLQPFLVPSELAAYKLAADMHLWLQVPRLWGQRT